MAKSVKKATSSKGRESVDRSGLADSLAKIVMNLTGAEIPEAAEVRINELANVLVFSEGENRSIASPKILSLMTTLAELKPNDEFERMLFGQMIACHEAIMDCYRRACNLGQTLEGRDNNLKHAEKLSAMYARQLEALDKHRGKGQQTVTVQHVHVQEGGQAIVANVEASNAHVPARPGKVAPPQIEQHKAVPDPLDALDREVSAARVRRSRNLG